MDNDNNFDLPALLRLYKLDIRKIAKNNPSMLVGDYFDSLTKFLKNAAVFISTLKNITAAQKFSDNDCKNITEMKALLVDIGHDGFVPVIDDIINVGKRGYIRSVAEYAEKLLNDIKELYEQIMTAKKDNKKESTNETQFPVEKQLLSKVLNLMDHEEQVRKMRILAVDDAPSIIKSISAALENDYKVFGISNPTMVEKFLQQITPELFLLDYEMPEINGFDLVPIIRKFKEHKDTPIIFLTSMGTIEHVSAAYALGACDFIVKPFQDIVLREKVSKHIVKKKLF